MARRAGVSVAVVSYVVNNGPRPVAPQTRQRVLDAIGELGYRPDTVARQLRTGRSGVIGVVLPDVSLPHFGELTQILSLRAGDQGQQLIIASTGWDQVAERQQLEFLAGRRVDGVILMSVDPLQDFRWLLELGTRVVVIDRPQAAIQGALAATHHLVEHGHERIGFIGGEARLVSNRRRREGWTSALVGDGLNAVPELMVAAPITREGGYEAARGLLTQTAPPTALYVDSDAQAVGVLRAASDLGLRVPEDLAIVSGEGTDTASFAVPRLTSIEIPRDEIAREALAGLADDEGTGDDVHWVSNNDFVLVPRESCGSHPR